MRPQTIYPCFDHQTMADLFDAIDVSWKYYTPSAGSIQTAPDAISHICVPSQPTGGECTGSDWVNDVILKPSQVLTDISALQAGPGELGHPEWQVFRSSLETTLAAGLPG